MKRVELKRIAEFLWRGTPADEKTPFASQGTLPDHGSFSKNLEADDNKKAAKEFPEDKGGLAAEGPMSIPRKLCFVMSFNLWILYFLVLGWLLPCRHFECRRPFQEVVERNLSSIVWLSTNVETMNAKGLPSLAILGYSDGVEYKLAAMASFDATFEWNNTLSFIPRNVQCNFENTFDANGDGYPDCLLSGFNDVYAFNASNGHVFWHQSFPFEEGNILSGFHPTAVRNNNSYLIGTRGDKMIALDAKTGNKTSEIRLPCLSPFKIKVVTNSGYANNTLWSLVCDYGDEIEAWGFRERDVLNGGNLENKAKAFEFALLFSGSNSGGSIDLGGDVTPIPGGSLLLSWSDRVVMVTPEATAWERHFPYPLSVASIKMGHFTSKENQVAAALRNGTDTIVVVMETKNGSIVKSVTLEDREVQSMDIVPGDMDLLVIKSLFFGNYTPPTYNFTDPIPWEQTNFVLVDFRAAKVKDIVTTFRVLGSALNTQTNGETDLILIKTENGNTSYQKYVIHASEAQNILCGKSNNVAHYSFET